LPVPTGFPIYFPADGGQTWLRLHYGGEWPDPLSSCPGYATPAGPPLIVQLGSGNLVPLVTDHGFYQEGVSLPHCVFDETNYSNSSLSTQNSGRAILNSRDAVVLMPRDPLQFGQTYTASITANAVQYSWTFAVVAPPQAAFPIPPGMERAGGP